MKYNFYLTENVCRIKPTYYNVIGTSVLVAASINILTSLFFLPKNSFEPPEIVCLIIGSILLLLSGFNFIKLGMQLEGFMPRVFSDFADSLRANVDSYERINFAAKLQGDGAAVISPKTSETAGRLFNECLHKNFSRIAHSVQPAFLSAIFLFVLGLGLLISSSPLFH